MCIQFIRENFSMALFVILHFFFFVHGEDRVYTSTRNVVGIATAEIPAECRLSKLINNYDDTSFYAFA